MERQRRGAACAENQGVADFIWDKRQEMAQSANGISEKVDATLYKAYCNVCNCKTPIKTLKDLSQIKGVGKWTLKLTQGFFGSGCAASEDENVPKKGKNSKSNKRYVPQKNSVAYALLITLYRTIENGSEFMRKQELIDAAEASGLSRAPIAAEKGKGKLRDFGSSGRDWYSGWSCMTTLINKGLVIKSSCPAKYKLTGEGKEAARECLSRSGLVDPEEENLAPVEGFSNMEQPDMPRANIQGGDMIDLDNAHATTLRVVAPASITSIRQKKSIDIPRESLDKLLQMGFSREEIIHAYSEVSESQSKDIASLWPAVLCHLRENQIYGQVNVSASERTVPSAAWNGQARDWKSSPSAGCTESLSPLKPCLSTDMNKQGSRRSQAKVQVLATPPLAFGERFQDAYEVILILDNREQFATQGSRSRNIIENICSQFKIQIEVRRLPVGDCIWIARHKLLRSEYVLDFIVERKKVDDLRQSIRDNRYRDQKLRILRCGLKKMIYLVEGDPNYSEAAESIKTACFTTEILEGFDVQRTTGLGDTLRKYGHLTQAINQYYKSLDPEQETPALCPRFSEFIKRCQDLDKLTVSDVFAIQLMQVPQVTEEIAIAVLDMYPTLISLARAYSLLDGDISSQEELLKKQSNSLISGIASRNIFRLVWGN